MVEKKLLGFCEIGSFAVAEDGKVNSKLLASVNKSLEQPDGKFVKEIAKVRVEMVETENTNAKNLDGQIQVYDKEIAAIQKIKPTKVDGKWIDTTTGNEMTPEEMKEAGIDSGSKFFLKNMIDNLRTSEIAQWIVIGALALAVGFALAWSKIHLLG